VRLENTIPDDENKRFSESFSLWTLGDPIAPSNNSPTLLVLVELTRKQVKLINQNWYAANQLIKFNDPTVQDSFVFDHTLAMNPGCYDLALLAYRFQVVLTPKMT